MRIGLLNAIVSFFACTLFFVCLSVHKCALLPYLVNAVWGLTHVGPGNNVLDGDPGPKGRALLRGACAGALQRTREYIAGALCLHSARSGRMHSSPRYDTLRYGRVTCAQKLTRWPA